MKIAKFFKSLLKSNEAGQQQPDLLNNKLDEIKSDKSEAKTQEKPIGKKTIQNENYHDNYEAYEKWLCPYCTHQFEKEITRKRKCPECKNSFLVRTHFETKRKMILKEEQQENYEKEREKYYDNKWIQDFFKRYGTTLEEKKRNSSSGSPYPYDIAWGMLNRVAMEKATCMQWGLFRNVRMDMGDLLRKEEKLEKSLLFYLEVCFLDINGATNTTTDSQLLKEFPPFRLDLAFLAPGILAYVEMLSEKLNLSLEEIKERFIEHNTRSYQGNSFVPLSPEKAWVTLEKELIERKSNNE